MKKYIIAFTFTMMGMMCVTSCNDSFLDEQIKSNYAPETLADPLGFDASLIGLHRHFSFLFTNSDQQGFLSVWQVGTDIAWATQPQGIENPYFRYAELSSQDGAASFVWTWAYKLIKNANVIVFNAENRAPDTMTQEQKDAINAEARFFRAYAYNMLVTLFGDVPLTTELVSEAQTDFVRAPVSDINALIEEDLLFAAASLPEITAVKKGGRANNAMARQLLAEAYLRMGRPADAEAQCAAIISSGKFSLVRNRYGSTAQPGDAFSDMFRMGKMRRSQGNTEGIWIFQMENPTDLPGAIGNAPQQRRIWGAGYHNIPGMIPADSLGGRGLSRLRLSNFVLRGLYPAGDMRNSKYTIKREFWFNDPAPAHASKYGKKVTPAASDTLFRMHPYTLKWGQFDPRDVFGFGMWKDLPLMRLGETYLLLAEAQFKQGNTPGAATSINELRTRANAPLVTAGDITLDFILDERARELVGEENRRMTLMRTGTLYNRIVTKNPPVAGNPGNINITGLELLAAGQKLLLPIPQSEIDLNKDAALPQNVGY